MADHTPVTRAALTAWQHLPTTLFVRFSERAMRADDRRPGQIRPDRARRRGRKGGLLAAVCPRAPWGGLASAAILGGAIEAAQVVVPGRTASLDDLMANAAGIAAGGLLYAAFRALRHRRAGPPPTAD